MVWRFALYTQTVFTVDCGSARAILPLMSSPVWFCLQGLFRFCLFILSAPFFSLILSAPFFSLQSLCVNFILSFRFFLFILCFCFGFSAPVFLRVGLGCAGVCLEEKDAGSMEVLKVMTVEEVVSILLPQTPEKARELVRWSFYKRPPRMPSWFLRDFIEVS